MDASRSASVPGSAAAWPANAETPRLEPALGEQRDAGEREEQDQAPQEDRRTVDDDRALGADQAAGAAVVLLEAGADPDGGDQRGDDAGAGEDDLGDVAALARQERLDDDAEAGDAEDDEQRRQLGVLDGGLARKACQ